MRLLVPAAFAALAWLTAAPAAAQNAICATAATGDNSNRCASTAFVQNTLAAGSNLPLANGKIYIGSIANVAAAQTLTGAGDCTVSLSNAGVATFTCTKTNGASFAASATTDTTNAANIASGVLAAARGGAGTINGALKGNGAGLVSKAATTDLSDVAAGTWTPSDNSGAGLTFSAVQASYTKVGNMVFAYAALTYPTTASGSNAAIAGLPVTVPNANYARGPCVAYSNSGALQAILLTGNTTGGVLINSSNAQLTNATLSGATVILTCIYPAS